MATAITLPYNWTPRHYQLPAFRALDGGIKRVLSVWHRRAGKDSACLNYMAKAAHDRVGAYFYFLPTQRQGRKVVWDNIDGNGRRMVDQAFPPPLRETTRDNEMFIRLKNGSTFQIVGGDNYDAVVGSNPVGVVFSEYALTNPMSWRFISPILAENGGWAWFNSTPRGKNHLFRLYETNKSNPDWFCEIKSVHDTQAIPLSVIEADIRAGMPQEIANQEYGCSFEAQNIGVVYAREMDKARADGRICDLPYDARYPVETWWDIGHRDATAIWFVQRLPSGALHVIDYLEDRSKGLPHYADELAKKGYAYSRHVGPHDMDNKIFAIDASTQMVARNYGLHFVIAPRLPKAEGINASRAMLSRCRFDASKCSRIIEALDDYQYKWNEDTEVLSPDTEHGWSSHCADALRYGAVAPEGVGVIPSWVELDQASIQPNFGLHSQIGHNGGPPMAADTYDPLAPWRKTA